MFIAKFISVFFLFFVLSVGHAANAVAFMSKYHQVMFDLMFHTIYNIVAASLRFYLTHGSKHARHYFLALYVFLKEWRNECTPFLFFYGTVLSLIGLCFVHSWDDCHISILAVSYATRISGIRLRKFGLLLISFRDLPTVFVCDRIPSEFMAYAYSLQRWGDKWIASHLCIKKGEFWIDAIFYFL